MQAGVCACDYTIPYCLQNSTKYAFGCILSYHLCGMYVLARSLLAAARLIGSSLGSSIQIALYVRPHAYFKVAAKAFDAMPFFLLFNKVSEMSSLICSSLSIFPSSRV